jgi:hypothetical protein
VVSDSLALAQLRAKHARAVMAHKRNPSPATREAVEQLRAAYTEAKLADYISRVVDNAPPLEDAQRDRLALLLRPGGDAA